MLKKKIILIIFIIGILTVSFVSATDNLTDETISTNNELVNAYETNSNDIININQSNDEINEYNYEKLTTNNENMLGNSLGYFSQLANKIQNAEAGSTIYLTQDYAFGNDYDYYNGVLIDKPITINGNGVMIDGSNAGGIFRITTDNVTIKNIKIKTSLSAYTVQDYSYDTGYKQHVDIDWNGNNGILCNITYIESNSFSPYNILIKINGNNNTISTLNVTSIYFKKYVQFFSNEDNCYADTYGLIYINGNNNVLKNSNFSHINIESTFFGDESINITRNGGIISITGDNNCLTNNCINNNIFTANSESETNTKTNWNKIISTIYGGIIYWNGNNGNLINSSLNNNKIISKSTAYYYQEYGYSIIKGGVIYWNGNGNIESTTLNSNYAYTIAYNYDREDRMIITSQSSQAIGGALYITSPNGLNSISNSNISKNYITSTYYKITSKTREEHKGFYYSNALYMNVSSGKIYNSIFDSNCDINDNFHTSNIVFDGNVDISHCIFSNHLYNDYAIECYGLETHINYNIFLNNPSQIQSSSKHANINYNWWGSDSNPQLRISGAVCDNWICSNLYVDETYIDEPIIYTKLNKLSDGTILSDEEYAKLPIRNVTYSLSGYGSLSSIKSNTIKGISYLNENEGLYEVKITSTIDNEVNEIIKILNITKFQEGSFTDLQNLIENTNSNIINLQKNYSYVPFDDKSMKKLFNYDAKEGIIINKQLTINGNGFTINGANIARIFNINSNDVALDKLNLINSSTENIYWNGENGILSNSQFSNIYIDSNANVSLINNKEQNNKYNHSILVKGGLTLQNNTFANLIEVMTGGTVYSKTMTSILDGEDKYVLPGKVDVYATIYDDNSNIIKVSDLKFHTDNNNYSSIFENNTFILPNFILNNSKIYSFTISTPSNLMNNELNTGKIISKIVEVNINLNKDTIQFKDIVIATITMASSNATGAISILIDDVKINEYAINDKNIIIELDDLNIGNHNITAIYGGNIHYIPTTSTKNITVEKWNTEITTKNYTITYSEDLFVEITILNNNATGNISLTVNSETYTENITKNKIIFRLPILNAGIYSFDVKYNGNQLYNEAKTNGLITVNKLKDFNIESVIPTEITYGDQIKLNFTFNRNVTGNISFKINTVNYLETVHDGKATFNLNNLDAKTYIITATYSGDINYESKNITINFIINKAEVDLSIGNIASVYFTNPSNFAVTINSNYKSVNEGTIKYFINNQLVGSDNVYHGSSSINYITCSTGTFRLTAVYEKTNNYLSSNVTRYFTVNKMPTTLNGETVCLDKNEYKTYTTELRDANNHGVANQVTTIEVAKYDGESRTFTGTSDSNGSTTYDINNLDEGMWTVRGIYTENDNFIGSSFTDKFIVIRMNTTTTIEEIDKPRVNYTYKLKANIHDENGKLVKEGIVQFFLDGVDIGTIDLSNNNRNQSALQSGLLDASIDDEAYLEYTPTKAGNFKLSAVYDGTTIYKSSTGETDFIVKDSWKSTTKLLTSDITTSYKGDGELIVTLMDSDASKAISNADLTVKLNNVAYTLKTDSSGQASISVPSNLSPKSYVAAISYAGNENYDSSNTTANIVVNKAGTLIYAPDVFLTYKDPNGELFAIVISEHGKPLVVNLNINFNGKDYTVRTDSNGQANIPIGTLSPGTYTATITYKGSSNYKASTTTAKITVTKAATSISASDVSLSYKEPNGELVATITNEHAKPLVVTLNINFNGKDYTVRTDSEGKASIEVGTLTPGKYSATVTYKGSANYKASTTTAKVTVTKANTNITAQDVSIAYKDSNGELVASIISEHGKALVVTLNIELNGKTYNVKTDSNGQASIAIGTLTPGKYDATISYKGSSNYKASTTTAKVTVTKAATSISAPDVSFAYKDFNGELVATIVSEHGKPLVVNLNVDLNGKTYTVKTDFDGKASIPIDTLKPGKYTATISYKGSSNYKASSTTAKVTVTKATTSISSSDVSIAYKDPNGELVTTIISEHGKPLVVTLNVEINGKTYNVKTDSNGQASIPIDTLTPGTYTATITYKGSSNYKASTTTPKITVTKAATIISAPDVSVAQKDPNGALVSTITNEHGKPLVVNLNVNLNGKTYTAKTDSNGQASVSTADLAPGTYTATITYKGSSNYKSTSTTANIQVKK